jgi:MarR family transcriptional regulator for hemolysin
VLRFDFQSSTNYWICSTARLVERAMHHELLPEGITHRQCQVLAWLAFKGELSQVSLADCMNIEPPTLVRILDRMERDGLLIREGCSSDRRKKIVRPLPQARPVWKKIVRCAERVRARATEGMTTAQMKTLQELLERVQNNLQDDEVGERACLLSNSEKRSALPPAAQKRMPSARATAAKAGQ